ncbi:5,6-dimethylbenzimidazole synthase [Gordonia sp. TBRC 11910]|uniref:5,6-dimethylbenzimidazole synthase n=2 Tax=Gordonia asplenii TaxID=2725283 RepID=A0A848KVP6_9ACTN|nr:5,6-dimethylbenzimidazole synthase [Gordonia asplenii]NMO00945.1 5,6-dimethylbenzimidazole synthase [Gordonia asplenii]
MSVYDAIRSRRDVRAEFTGEVIADEVLARLLDAAHHAPSVGNTQPWDFIVVRDPQRLKHFADHVAAKRKEFADSLPPERAQVFDPIKVEGVRESGTGIVVTYDHSRGGTHILGRASIPETGVFSAALAIQNLWLAAAAEGIGVGWVSFYDRDVLADFIAAPDGVVPIAWLCVGPVEEFQTVPDLERFGWRNRRPLADAIHADVFGKRQD